MRRTRLDPSALPDAGGHFGRGGRFVPETLMSPLIDLERAYRAARRDPAFRVRPRDLLTTYAGRPTPLDLAERRTRQGGGARTFLKREDLCHTGADKINEVLGVTGTRSELPSDLAAHLRALRGITTKPICVGFGTSTPEQAGLVGRHADGVIVGSAIVALVERHAESPDLLRTIGDFIAAPRAPLPGGNGGARE